MIDDRGKELMEVWNLDVAEGAQPRLEKAAKAHPVQPAVARVTKRRGRKS